jgi:hypothetical protein
MGYRHATLTIYRRAALARMLGARISERPVVLSLPACASARARRVRTLSRASPASSSSSSSSLWTDAEYLPWRSERERERGRRGGGVEADGVPEEEGSLQQASSGGAGYAWPHESDGTDAILFN